MESPPDDNLQIIWDGRSSNQAENGPNPTPFISTQTSVQSEHNPCSTSCADTDVQSDYNGQPFSFPIARNDTLGMLSSDIAALDGPPCYLDNTIRSKLTMPGLCPASFVQPVFNLFDNTSFGPQPDTNLLLELEPQFDSLLDPGSLINSEPNPLIEASLNLSNTSFGPSDYVQLPYLQFTNSTGFSLQPDHNPADNSHPSHNTSLSTTFDMMYWSHLTEMGSAATNSFTAAFEQNAHFPSTTSQHHVISNPTEVTNLHYESELQKPGSSNEQSVHDCTSTQPRNQMATAPQWLVAPSNPTNITSTVASSSSIHTKIPSVSAVSVTEHSVRPSKAPKRKRSTSPPIKSKGIPPEMMGIFELAKRDTTHAHPATKRAKSTCIRCQHHRKKCDGVVPCEKCLHYAESNGLKAELTCIDADVCKLNHFAVFLTFHFNTHPDSFVPLYFSVLAGSEGSKFPEIMDAVDTLTSSFMEPTRVGRDQAQLTTFFSYFALTGVPAHQASYILSSPPVVAWRVPKAKKSSCRPSSDAATFIVAITQIPTLARLANLPERVIEIWSSQFSLYFFQETKVLLHKNQRHRTSNEERQALCENLIALLFLSEIRGTHVWDAAVRTREDYPENNPSALPSFVEHLLDGSMYLNAHISTSLELRTHLRLWARYWLLNQFPDSEFDKKIKPAAYSCIRLCSMDLGTDAERAREDVSMVDLIGCEMESGSESGEEDPEKDGYAQWVGIYIGVVLRVEKSTKGYSKMRELKRNLDILLCLDLEELFSPDPRSKEEDINSGVCSRKQLDHVEFENTLELVRVHGNDPDLLEMNLADKIRAWIKRE